VHYAASKGAVDTFTIGLAREVASEGIRVNAVRPGMIDTEIHASTGAPERVARIIPTVPMKRIGTPEEVAQTVLWLLSDQASYVTGAIVDVSGAESHTLTLTLSRFAVEGTPLVQPPRPSPLYREAGEG
jgi:NAD(P)-dependent dehydrogenase (short-subunit alcohol dehydrogenase family)